MTCEEVRNSFGKFLDEQLSALEEKQVVTHLHSCADCLKEFSREARTAINAKRITTSPIPPWPGVVEGEPLIVQHD